MILHALGQLNDVGLDLQFKSTVLCCVWRKTQKLTSIQFSCKQVQATEGNKCFLCKMHWRSRERDILIYIYIYIYWHYLALSFLASMFLDYFSPSLTAASKKNFRIICSEWRPLWLSQKVWCTEGLTHKKSWKRDRLPTSTPQLWKSRIDPAWRNYQTKNSKAQSPKKTNENNSIRFTSQHQKARKNQTEKLYITLLF